MKKILDDIKLKYAEADNEAAFYGPKLDIQFKNVFGKEDTLITIQVDFALPGRFGMEYVDSDGSQKTPMVIHRSSIGCYERTLAMLIEHYGGAFPVWLSPVQAVIIPISDEHREYACKAAEELRGRGIRAEIDDKSGRMQHKIRDAEMQKVPYMLVVGGKEAQAESVSVRERGKGDLGAMKLADFIKKIAGEVEEKK
jgi:threonyl-tRNA synthetase